MKKTIYLIIFLVFPQCLNTKPKKFIRAQCIIEHPDYWVRFLELEPLFKKFGLCFVDKDPDVILCNRFFPEQLKTNKPVIILERKASAFLWGRTRKTISSPQVKAVFKNRVLKDKSLYNTPVCAQSWHFRLINDYANLFRIKNSRYIESVDLDKICCVLWSLDNSPFSKKAENLKNIKINFNKDRPIDVFFAGRVTVLGDNKGRKLFTYHRKQAIKQLKKISGINITCLDSNKALSFQDYIDTIKKSKIVVSPWGTGAWAHRDYEAIHCGAVLLKPDTAFLQAIPDIYQNNVTYVPCLPDFSDLEEQIRKILENYSDYQHMRKYAKQILVDSWDMEKLAFDFVQAVKNALYQ